MPLPIPLNAAHDVVSNRIWVQNNELYKINEIFLYNLIYTSG